MIYGILFLLGLILGIIIGNELISFLILLVVGYIIWFYIGYKVLDKVRFMCNKFNSFLVLIVMWFTVGALSVFTTILINIITGQPFYKDANDGVAFGGIILMLIIDFFYNRSRKKLKK